MFSDVLTRLVVSFPSALVAQIISLHLENTKLTSSQFRASKPSRLRKSSGLRRPDTKVRFVAYGRSRKIKETSCTTFLILDGSSERPTSWHCPRTSSSRWAQIALHVTFGPTSIYVSFVQGKKAPIPSSREQVVVIVGATCPVAGTLSSPMRFVRLCVIKCVDRER